jgi:hypothetical protein
MEKANRQGESQRDSQRQSRRRFITLSLGGVVVLAARSAEAQDLPLAQESEATPKALGYVSDVSKIDASKAPGYKAGSKCANCMQYKGRPTDARAPCSIIAGRSVPANAWCTAWVQRSG